MSDSEKENEVYEVETIIRKRIRNNRAEFYVKYKNLDENHNMWLYEDKLDCIELLKKFKQHKAIEKKSRSEIATKTIKPTQIKQEKTIPLVDNNIGRKVSASISKSQGIFAKR